MRVTDASFIFSDFSTSLPTNVVSGNNAPVSACNFVKRMVLKLVLIDEITSTATDSFRLCTISTGYPISDAE